MPDLPTTLPSLPLDPELTTQEPRKMARVDERNLALWQAACERCNERLKEIYAELIKRGAI